MQELQLNKVNVLGTFVCDCEPDKSLALSLKAMYSHELNIVFFLSAAGSLFCQETPWAMDLVNSFPLVFPGDRDTEMAVRHQVFQGENGPGEFVWEYMAGLLSHLQRESRELFLVTASRDMLTTFMDDLADRYPDISVSGMVYEQDVEGAADKVVNEINALIPHLLPPKLQLMLLRDYESMMNAGLCICIDSLYPLLHKESRPVPAWVHALHLDSLFRWFHKEVRLESRMESRIQKSLFRRKMTEENMLDTEQDEQKQ